jgi:hypothetical protein
MDFLAMLPAIANLPLTADLLRWRFVVEGLAFIDDMHCEKFYRFVADHLEGVVGYMADINGGISARTQADGTLTDSFGATSLGPPDCRILLSPNGDCGIALLSSKIA